MNINVRRVYSLLSAHPKLAARRKRGGEWQFRILDAGTKRVHAEPGAVLLVDPANPITAIIELHGFLAQLRGTVRVCDPYLDPTTLSHLDVCKSGVGLALLTAHIREEPTLRAAMRHFIRNQRTLAIRLSTTGKLHDRYIIDNGHAFLLGTSLNGFGKSQSTIVTVGPDVRTALLKLFEDEWNAASPWQ